MGAASPRTGQSVAAETADWRGCGAFGNRLIQVSQMPTFARNMGLASEEKGRQGAANITDGCRRRRSAPGQRRLNIPRQLLRRVLRRVAADHLAVLADQKLGEIPLDGLAAQ